MFVDFFIRRPVFASVCAIVIVLLGAISIPTLPIAQYPELAPPQVQVTSLYIGANAQAVESAVTTPLEEQINGVEGMRYMSSTSGNDGTSNITVTFEVGRNKDIAAVDVQNRVNTALASLPIEVRNTGVTVIKTTPAIILAAGFFSEDGSLSDVFISNYVDVYVRDPLKRIKGVGDVRIFGERKYAMRIWLDPDKLAARGLTATDVTAALRDQNAQIAAGQVGQPPTPPGQSFQISVRALGRLSDPGQFERIVVGRGEDGALVTLADVGTVSLGAEDYSSRLRFDGREAVGVGIFQLPDANALDLEREVRAELTRLSKRFPPSMKYELAFNPTDAVRDSIREVLTTLFEAIALVIFVIFIFLQDWRSTVIPAITIPVSLIGTFAFIKAFGFSINTLTLFGIVLATGLVVDDAIVVVENIERNLSEGKTGGPPEAARRAMGEVAGAVIATSLVLIAVFVPAGFLPGTTGRLYKQFSLTIAFAVAISTFNALTLSPAIAALFMRKPRERRFVFFRWFNRGFEAGRRRYQGLLRVLLGHRALVMLAFAAGLACTYLVFKRVPRGFVPDEDQNYIIIQMLGPPGASLEHMNGVAKEIEGQLRTRPEVQNIFSVAGFNFAGNGANRGTIFASLTPISKRKKASQSSIALVRDMQPKLGGLTGALVVPFLPPPIQGQGSTGGFTFELIDRVGTLDFPELAQIQQQLMGEALKGGQVRGLFGLFSADDPQLVLEIDREKAKSLGVSVAGIGETLGVYMGSQYVNDFDFNNRSYRVYAQADGKFRTQPADIGGLYVRAGSGALTPLDTVVRPEASSAPQVITHFNLYRSMELNGTPAPRVSTGQALSEMQRVAGRVLPADMSYDWSGLSWEEVRAGSASLVIFVLGLLFVFLVLAAQYESFSLPFTIILAVPLALLGALSAQLLRGLTNDVFCQVGLLMLIGLASKNAILIVEFAEQLRGRGMTAKDAVIQSVSLRLRPILMTSFAFILGILPLVFATGSGANARRSLGTAVSGGLLLSTILNLFFTPVLYLIVESARERLGRRKRADA